MIRAIFELHNRLRRNDIKFIHLVALAACPTYMTKLGTALQQSSASITGLVDRMEKMGLVTRVHTKENRRKVFVELTEKGRVVLESVTHEKIPVKKPYSDAVNEGDAYSGQM